MSLIARATGLLARIQALGWKESALRYYRTGDIHQLYGNQVGTDSFGNLYEFVPRYRPQLVDVIETPLRQKYT